MPDYYTGNFYLSQAQMETNATYIYNALYTLGWTVNAIAGLLGNAQTESTINPGIWQSLKVNVGPGYGLTQWTPYSKYFNYCNQLGIEPSAMDSALSRLDYEVNHPSEQWVVHKNYPLTFPEFIKSEASPYYLGMTFLNNYEMPGQINQPIRGTQAERWYQFLTGQTPPTPEPGTGGNDRNEYKKGKGLPIWIYIRRKHYG